MDTRPATCAWALHRDLRGQQTGPRPDTEHLSTGIDWLISSQDATNCGGSAAYYSLLTGWSGPYPETSGYIIPTLYDYAAYTDSDKTSTEGPYARQRARQMANWLLKTQLNSGAFPSGTNPVPRSDPSVFNTGQILLGLVRAFYETGDERFLGAIERAGTWLADVQHEEGYWDRFDYRSEVHSYCSRVAWALLKSYEVTSNNKFLQSATKHLEWVISVQTNTEWFEYAAFSPDEVPYLHTIAYTVRGLLEAGLWLDDDTLVSAARATADQLLTCRQEDGPLSGAYDRSWDGRDFYCLTGNAQVALVWLRLYEKFNNEQYLTAATAEIEFLKKQHLLDGPSPLQGGIKGSHPVWASYMRLRYPNWAVKFFCDAIIIKEHVRKDSDLYHWDNYRK